MQVKSTICQLTTGYDCTVRGGHKAYAPGSFDFLAAFVVPEDAWHIIPAKLIRGKSSITLIPESQTATYEEYREAWHLLREASEGSGQNGAGDAEAGSEDSARPEDVRGEPHPTNALGRTEASMNYFKQRLERGGVDPQKR